MARADKARKAFVSRVNDIFYDFYERDLPPENLVALFLMPIAAYFGKKSEPRSVLNVMLWQLGIQADSVDLSDDLNQECFAQIAKVWNSPKIEQWPQIWAGVIANGLTLFDSSIPFETAFKRATRAIIAGGEGVKKWENMPESQKRLLDRLMDILNHFRAAGLSHETLIVQLLLSIAMIIGASSSNVSNTESILRAMLVRLQIDEPEDAPSAQVNDCRQQIWKAVGESDLDDEAASTTLMIMAASAMHAINPITSPEAIVNLLDDACLAGSTESTCSVSTRPN